ncbi:MAG: NUDIX hydrolase [Actinobacteria bacterium ATB1]|nr:NUDIX hydrolase [Actinobacteria bacterium ATB1]
MVVAELELYTYCPFCASPLVAVEQEGTVRPTCSAGHFRQYGNPAPAANGIVQSGTDLLLVRRAREPFAGLWALPGGFVEWDEDPAETAVREVLEETGLAVGITGLPLLLLDRGDPRGNTLSANYPAELVDPRQNEPHPGDDADDARWWPVANLPPLAFENHVRALGYMGIEAAAAVPADPKAKNSPAPADQ